MLTVVVQSFWQAVAFGQQPVFLCDMYNNYPLFVAVCTKRGRFVDVSQQAGYNVSIKADACDGFRQMDDMDNVVLVSVTKGRRGGNFFIA